MALGKRKILVAAGVITLFALIGTVVAIVVWQTSNGSESEANNTTAEDTTASSTGDQSLRGSSVSSTDSDSGSSSKSTSSASVAGEASAPSSDPTKEKFTLSAYAIGDWGTTIARDSCCKRRTDHTPTNIDKNAEEAVGVLMGKAAETADPKPQVVLGHGDNFYWTGIIDAKDQEYRFSNTFETKFDDSALAEIPWVNVMGNHDYGGASYICSSGGAMAPCADTAALLQGLKDKFSLQAEYKSPNSDRWIMKDHFYVHSIEDKDSGVTIDIFNMDTNDADSHGAQQICCQCYGYSEGKDSACNSVARGDPFCAGGNTDMFDACMNQLSEWGDESRSQLAEKVKASKADWKIVNTHYSPYNHYAANKQDMWQKLLSGLGVQLYINGHTHGEKHDYANFKVHFIENGAGGGILNEAASGIPPYVDYAENLWTYANHDYGFFELSGSKEWLRVRFLTFDDAWNIQDDFSQSTIGGVAAHHCWYIPVDGSKGQSCDA